MQIPTLLLSSLLPAAYYITFVGAFDIDTTLFLLVQRAEALAPSLPDILSAQNVTCAGARECRTVLTGLTPATNYSIYYWFRSAEGAEPLEPVSRMVLPTATTPVLPYNLTIVAAGGEVDFITVEVDIAGRGGYVWCTAWEDEEVPPVAQLKLGARVEIPEGSERGWNVIPLLLPGRLYHGYCYAEDYYGDAAATAVADTHFMVWTATEAMVWNASLSASPAFTNITILSNRNATTCCLAQAAGPAPSLAWLRETGSCTWAAAGTPGEVAVATPDDTELDVFCALRTDSLVDVYDAEPLFSLRTPARAPAVEHLGTVRTYQAAYLTLRADRSARGWCAVSDPQGPEPSVEELKQGAATALPRETAVELLVGDLQAETDYRVSCWAESAEGLPMTTPRADLTFALRTLPSRAAARLRASGARPHRDLLDALLHRSLPSRGRDGSLRRALPRAAPHRPRPWPGGLRGPRRAAHRVARRGPRVGAERDDRVQRLLPRARRLRPAHAHRDRGDARGLLDAAR